jgi:hypothetical protein
MEIYQKHSKPPEIICFYVRCTLNPISVCFEQLVELNSIRIKTTPFFHFLNLTS